MLKVGLHGRNDTVFEDVDYRVLEQMNAKVVKMMSQTSPGVFYALRERLPEAEIITRLYDNRMGVNSHPTPAEFAGKMVPVMKAIGAYCTRFEVHNEPNHVHRYEGWGDGDLDAQDFNTWFLEVYDRLKDACPWALLGFPGLAIPHRDLEWVEVCRPAVERADWLGVHCYWQTPPAQPETHLNDFWGLRFKHYHRKFPQKTIEITECGNSNIQAVPPIPITEEALGQQYAEYCRAVAVYPYVNSLAFFILSSPDKTWDFFAWRTRDGRVKPWAQIVGSTTLPKPAAGAVAPPLLQTPKDELGHIVENLYQIAEELAGIAAGLTRFNVTRD